jgi:hypothetical protein
MREIYERESRTGVLAATLSSRTAEKSEEECWHGAAVELYTTGIIQLSEELRGNEPRKAQSGPTRLAPPDFQWSHRALRALDSRWRLMHERSQPLQAR